MAWDCLASHTTLHDIMNDAGLAKLGDSLVNLCYSLAKSIVIGCATGEKVKDSVLARAIRTSPIYASVGHRTDPGDAADAYEALMAWLWLNRKTTIEFVVDSLAKNLLAQPTKSARREDESAVQAFQYLLEQVTNQLPVC
jgi:dsRNA-specific ribonuclease